MKSIVKVLLAIWDAGTMPRLTFMLHCRLWVLGLCLCCIYSVWCLGYRCLAMAVYAILLWESIFGRHKWFYRDDYKPSAIEGFSILFFTALILMILLP
jgi:hypothetical protein